MSLLAAARMWGLRAGRVGCCGVLAWALSACVSTAPPPVGEALSGRIAVRVPAQGAEPARAVGAAFELQGNAERGTLRLLSPLGTTIAQAQWAPQQARLVSAEGTVDFADMDALTQQMLGEALPVAALFDWLRGRPRSGAANTPASEPSGFAQLGWRVDLSRWAEGWVLAQRQEPPLVSVRARLDRTGTAE